MHPAKDKTLQCQNVKLSVAAFNTTGCKSVSILQRDVSIIVVAMITMTTVTIVAICI